MKTKNKFGRKSVKPIIEKNLGKIKELAQNGFTNLQIARAIGISEDRFYEYQKTYTEFSETLKEAKDKADNNVVNSLYKAALGYEVIEEHIEYADTDDKIKVKTVKKIKKHIKPDTTAQIYWLNNRMSSVFRTRQEIAHKILDKKEAEKALKEMFE